MRESKLNKETIISLLGLAENLASLEGTADVMKGVCLIVDKFISDEDICLKCTRGMLSKLYVIDHSK